MLRLRDMRAVGCCQSAKLHIFHTPHVFLGRIRDLSHDITIRVGFGMQVAKTAVYLSYAQFHFLLHYVIAIKNPPTLQTDRRTSLAAYV